MKNILLIIALLLSCSIDSTAQRLKQLQKGTDTGQVGITDGTKKAQKYFTLASYLADSLNITADYDSLYYKQDSICNQDDICVDLSPLTQGLQVTDLDSLYIKGDSICNQRDICVYVASGGGADLDSLFIRSDSLLNQRDQGVLISDLRDTDWLENGSDIYRYDKVGIGTSSPTASLHLGANEDVVLDNWLWFNTSKSYGMRHNNSTKMLFEISGAAVLEWSRIGSTGFRQSLSQFSTGATASGAPAITFLQDEDSGLYLDGVGACGISAGNSRRLTAYTDRVKIWEDLELEKAIIDASGTGGTSGQILSSTGTATDWIDLPAGFSGSWNDLSDIPAGFADDIDDASPWTTTSQGALYYDALATNSETHVSIGKDSGYGAYLLNLEGDIWLDEGTIVDSNNDKASGNQFLGQSSNESDWQWVFPNMSIIGSDLYIQNQASNTSNIDNIPLSSLNFISQNGTDLYYDGGGFAIGQNSTSDDFEVNGTARFDKIKDSLGDNGSQGDYLMSGDQDFVYWSNPFAYAKLSTNVEESASGTLTYANMSVSESSGSDLTPTTSDNRITVNTTGTYEITINVYIDAGVSTVNFLKAVIYINAGGLVSENYESLYLKRTEENYSVTFIEDLTSGSYYRLAFANTSFTGTMDYEASWSVKKIK